MSSAARYYPRAPRYVFKPSEQRLMRFKPLEARADSTRAQVRNISATGLSFIVSPGEAPIEGEMLKIEFALPAGQESSAKNTRIPRQVAWFADVVRVESRIEWVPWAMDQTSERAITIVALRFRKLPAALTKALNQSLRGKYFANEAPEFDLSHINQTEIAAFSALSIFSIILMALISFPPTTWLSAIRGLF